MSYNYSSYCYWDEIHLLRRVKSGNSSVPGCQLLSKIQTWFLQCQLGQFFRRPWCLIICTFVCFVLFCFVFFIERLNLVRYFAMTFVFEVIIGLVPPLKGAFDKFNIIPPKIVGIFIPLEVFAWVKTACPVIRSRLTYFWRNTNISSIFYFSKSTSIIKDTIHTVTYGAFWRWSCSQNTS